ncbi:MAG: hypothetical protein CMO74_13795 [Verrucomicrobiales bacterium]|nr:hypothetical protein [Verrucomicrobiales bacterium]|tara:strand:+ start:78260 stop:78490 length:231 start_codon:yes stop_codon:yes gene_type:complete
MTNEEIREQIQENIIAYMNPLLDREYEITNDNIDDLCQIVVDCFAEDKKTNDSDKYFYHPEEVYNRAWMDAKHSKY